MTNIANAVSGQQYIAALVIGIILLVFMMLRTKIHSFLAILIAALVIGAICRMETNIIVQAITAGFGNTLGSIGIIIGFGVMMGQIFEITGAAETMAKAFLKVLGRGRERIALAITGFIVSIPIFCDSGFIVLFPIVRSLAKKTKISVVSLGTALAAGLVITHSLVPPTPGPVGVAGIFGVNVGSLILLGIVVAIPMLIACIIYAKYLNKEIYQLPDETGGWIRPKSVMGAVDIDLTSVNKDLPSAFKSFFPILLPIAFILCGTIMKAIYPDSNIAQYSPQLMNIRSVTLFLGTPIIAVGSGMLASIYLLTGKISRKDTISAMDDGARAAGMIILLTGAGGALGRVITVSGAGEYIANIIANTEIPAIIIPFIVASIIRVIQGSGTVAMLTSASITQPIVSQMDVLPLFAALSACIGSLLFSHFNDSFFWVVNRSMGITEAKEQIRVWSFTTSIAWATGFVVLMLIYLFY